MSDAPEACTFIRPRPAPRGHARKRETADTDAAQTAPTHAASAEAIAGFDDEGSAPVKKRRPPQLLSGPLSSTTTMTRPARVAHVATGHYAASGTAQSLAVPGQHAASGTRESEIALSEDGSAAPAKRPAARATVGPIRAPANIRSTCTFDFQPEICKDYKETGYCSFGDNCKFLHDRGDYKSGWQLERDWESARRGGGSGSGRGSSLQQEEDVEEEEKEEDLPFACLKCRSRWSAAHKPVQTRCGHLFCEACLLAHFRKSTKCPLCGAPTGGSYSCPRSLLEKLERSRQRALAEEASSVDPEESVQDSKPRDARLDRRTVSS